MTESGSLADWAERQHDAARRLEDLGELMQDAKLEMPRIVECLHRLDASLTEASDVAWQYGQLRAQVHISQAQGVLAALYATLEAMEPYIDWI